MATPVPDDLDTDFPENVLAYAMATALPDDLDIDFPPERRLDIPISKFNISTGVVCVKKLNVHELRSELYWLNYSCDASMFRTPAEQSHCKHC